MVFGSLPSEWIAAGAFPALKILDLTNQELTSPTYSVFGDRWYTKTKQGGMPKLEQLLLFYCSIEPGECMRHDEDACAASRYAPQTCTKLETQPGTTTTRCPLQWPCPTRSGSWTL